MIPLIGALLPVVGKVLDRVIPDKAAAETAKMEMQRLYVEGDMRALEADVSLALGQMEVNKAEAAHSSIFVAGWRPAVGWVCVAGIGWQFFARPIAGWITVLIDATLPMPPPLDMGDLMTLLGGMLGIGGFRTYEKLRGVARKRVSE